MRKSYHVTFEKDTQKWCVKLAGAKFASAKYPTKVEAIARGKELAKKPKLGQLIVHKKDGKIQTEYTYGSDPSRSRG